jgi:hypothetical protein
MRIVAVSRRLLPLPQGAIHVETFSCSSPVAHYLLMLLTGGAGLAVFAHGSFGKQKSDFR